MEKEIFISENGFINDLNALSNKIEDKFNISVWFVEIFGRRWSFIAGNIEDSILPTENYRINDRYGIVSNKWEKITLKEKDILFDSVRIIMKKYGKG
ncbi:hypothetical protein KAU43_01110 [candidate division WOR-3 bacterium]|jgi:hypothetical protein|nr:hypothetical protein [candidate division WOR-3 bacterium]